MVSKFIDFIHKRLEQAGLLEKVINANEQNMQDQENGYNLKQEEKTQLISTIIADQGIDKVKPFLIEAGFNESDFESVQKFKKIHLGTDEQSGVVYYGFLIPPRFEIPIHSHTGPCSSAHFTGGKAEGHYRDIDTQSALATEKSFFEQVALNVSLQSYDAIVDVAVYLLRDSTIINPVSINHSQPGETTYVRPSEISTNISLDEHSGGVTYDKEYFKRNSEDIKSYLIKHHGLKKEAGEDEKLFQGRAEKLIGENYGSSFLYEFNQFAGKYYGRNELFQKYENAIARGKEVAAGIVNDPNNFADFHTVINTDHNKPTILIHTYSLNREINGKVSRIPDANNLPLTAENYIGAFKHAYPTTLKVVAEGDQRYMPIRYPDPEIYNAEAKGAKINQHQTQI